MRAKRKPSPSITHAWRLVEQADPWCLEFPTLIDLPHTLTIAGINFIDPDHN
jgi:hypothetical protein